MAAHVSGPGDAQAAIELGVDSLEHGPDVPLEALGALGQRRGAWTPTLLTGWRDGRSHSPVAAWQRAHSAGAGTLADEISLLATLGMAPADALAAGSSSARGPTWASRDWSPDALRTWSPTTTTHVTTSPWSSTRPPSSDTGAAFDDTLTPSGPPREVAPSSERSAASGGPPICSAPRPPLDNHSTYCVAAIVVSGRVMPGGRADDLAAVVDVHVGEGNRPAGPRSDIERGTWWPMTATSDLTALRGEAGWLPIASTLSRVATASGVRVLDGSRPGGEGPPRLARRRAPRRPVVAAVAVTGVVLALSLTRAGSGRRAVTSPASAGSPTAHPPVAGLPTLGPSTAVEVDNPDLNDVGDPYVLAVPAGSAGGPAAGYVMYWTTDWAANVPTAVSTDLIHWRRVADSLPTLPTWAMLVRPPGSWSAPPGTSTMTWGPTVHQVSGGWALYYSTEDASTQRECLGVALSSSPTGPFSDTSSVPLVCQGDLGGDIDPSVVVPAPGQLALVWKNDGNANGSPVSIWEQPLTSDGRSTTGTPVRLIGADQAWEHNIIEGPSMLADTKGGWWLFYSGGTWQSDTYDTGVAWCATVAGPCKKPARSPLLASTPTAVSPGGLDTFVDQQGRLWASYSAFPTQPADARAAMASPRVLELAPLLSH